MLAIIISISGRKPENYKPWAQKKVPSGFFMFSILTKLFYVFNTNKEELGGWYSPGWELLIPLAQPKIYQAGESKASHLLMIMSKVAETLPDLNMEKKT